MIVNNGSLQKVDNHWAVLAIGEAERNYGFRIADAILVKKAIGHQMDLDPIEYKRYTKRVPI
jgi:hypothetical protein